MPITGLVTNVFRCQLDGGSPLRALLQEAHARGYDTFELRQGAMGEFEDSDRIPLPERLASLPRELPGCRFNLAIEWPVFSAPYEIDNPLYVAARDAAFALRSERGHLRLVDLTREVPLLEGDSRLQAQAHCLAMLAADAVASGVYVSIEHGRQPLCVARRLVRETGGLLESYGFVAASNLGLCVDPCNMVNSALLREDPVEAVAAMRAEEILMFHVKQSRGGVMLPTVEEGDVNWPEVWSTLRRLRYDGPICFEVSPSDKVWLNLERSTYFTPEG